jgi:hypothetical protein
MKFDRLDAPRAYLISSPANAARLECSEDGAAVQACCVCSFGKRVGHGVCVMMRCLDAHMMQRLG